MKIYYAHCTMLFDTVQETKDLEILENLGFEIVNPNMPYHKKGYEQRGMNYYIEDVLPECDGIAFRALPGGALSAGVSTEVEYFLNDAIRNHPYLIYLKKLWLLFLL